MEEWKSFRPHHNRSDPGTQPLDDFIGTILNEVQTRSF